MLAFAVTILVAGIVVVAVYLVVAGGREFTAPERPSSPREYWG